VLQALSDVWRPLFATAIYTGLRKGELLGVRKTDVDLVGERITVTRTYDRDTTKSGHAEALPIATELMPYLRVAMDRSAQSARSCTPRLAVVCQPLRLQVNSSVRNRSAASADRSGWSLRSTYTWTG